MESGESTLLTTFVTKGMELLVLRSSLMLSFPREHQVGIRRLLWLRASAHCFIHTNEECSISDIVGEFDFRRDVLFFSSIKGG